MEHDQEQGKLFSAFDEKIIPESLRLFKCCLSLFPVSNRPMLAILIKFLELKLTIEYFHSGSRTDPIFQNRELSLDSVLSALNPDLKEEMEMFQSMVQMMQMTQAVPSSDSGNAAGIFQDLFSSSMSDAYDNTKTASEEVNDGRMDETSRIFKSSPDQTGTSASGLSEDQGKDGQESGSGTDGADRERQ